MTLSNHRDCSRTAWLYPRVRIACAFSTCPPGPRYIHTDHRDGSPNASSLCAFSAREREWPQSCIFHRETGRGIPCAFSDRPGSRQRIHIGHKNMILNNLVIISVEIISKLITSLYSIVLIKSETKRSSSN